MSIPSFLGEHTPRWLHPVAWWVWALGTATAASATTNPLFLVGVMTAALVITATHGTRAPWAASLSVLVRIAIALCVFRLTMQSLLGIPLGTHVLFSLPRLPLPGVLSGVRIGGPVMLESVLIGLVEGLRFAAIVIAIGAASTVAAPARLFRALPARAADVGTLLIVAMTIVPHLVADVRRTRTARRLRGRSLRGVRSVGQTIAPVLDAALDRSMRLAVSMRSRGYGTTATRTRHRPEPWRPAETVVAASGVAVACICGVLAARGADASLSVVPLAWPSLPTPMAIALLVVAAPAVAAPRTPDTLAVQVTP